MSKTGYDAMEDEPSNRPRHYPPGGFDVTATIGHVEFSAMGDMTPAEAAMALIGRHDAEGVYTFPHEDGRTITVEVSYGHA